MVGLVIVVVVVVVVVVEAGVMIMGMTMVAEGYNMACNRSFCAMENVHVVGDNVGLTKEEVEPSDRDDSNVGLVVGVVEVVGGGDA